MNLRQAIRRIMSVSILLGILGLSTSGIWVASAQDGSGGRFKTVELKVTQYVWRLVSFSTGRTLCEVLIEHQGQPNNIEAFNLCYSQIYGPTNPTPTVANTSTPQPTQAPIDMTDLLEIGAWHYVETRTFTRTIRIPLPDLITSINAPSGSVPEPYVLVSAYEPVPEYKLVAIRGTVNNAQFECTASPCRVPVKQDSVIMFWAISSAGDESPHVRADVRITFSGTGYTVTISSISPFRFYSDAAAQVWGMPSFSLPKWAEFPLTPERLNTNKNLYYLASRLITVGLVNADSCPGKGFLSPGSPNACGMEKAYSAMVQWQNQFDPIIWTTSRDIGIPPRLIKSIIERESQFWPGNSRFFIYEYGLAQMNQIGADVALRYDNDLFQRVCEGLLFDCSVPYASLPSWMQATVRGGLIRSINADCPTCNFGVDLFAAQQSIPIIAQVLRSNTQQVKFIINLVGAPVASYEDMWKFTLVSYNAGYQCLFDAVDQAKKLGQSITWANVSLQLTCPNTAGYVNDIFLALNDFDNFQLKPEQAQEPVVQPTFIPTPAPSPSPTPVPARSRIRTIVYIDSNGDQTPQPNEAVNGVQVQVSFPDGSSLVQTTTNGEAIFDMTGRSVGTVATVSIPSLYRITLVRVTEQGDIPVFFRLLQPPLPPKIP